MLFKLLESQHVGPDYSQDPVELKDPVTGKVTKKYPSKVYNKGDVIDSGDYDLAARLGANKFQLVEGGRRRKRGEAQDESTPLLPSMTTPHGQVTQGHQVASVSDVGLPTSRAMTADEAHEAGLTAPPTSASNRAQQVSPPPGSDANKGDGNESSKDAKHPKQKLKDQYVLDEMTKEELKDLAEMEEVDIKGCRTKEEILAELKKH